MYIIIRGGEHGDGQGRHKVWMQEPTSLSARKREELAERGVTLKSFSLVLSSLRRDKGLSQRQVASDLGVSQALLSHYENDAREPKLEFVVKACDYYNVTADYILGRTDDRGDKPPLLIEILNGAVSDLQELKSAGDAIIEKLKYLTIDD